MHVHVGRHWATTSCPPSCKTQRWPVLGMAGLLQNLRGVSRRCLVRLLILHMALLFKPYIFFSHRIRTPHNDAPRPLRATYCFTNPGASLLPAAVPFQFLTHCTCQRNSLSLVTSLGTVLRRRRGMLSLSTCSVSSHNVACAAQPIHACIQL